MTNRAAPTEAEVISWFETLSNWGRWGDDDTLGTLNLVTDQKRRQAAGLVREGVAVSCAWPIGFRAEADHAFGSPQRKMLSTGERPNDTGRRLPAGEQRPRWSGASEFIGLVFHGYSVTHLDALSHYFWDGRMYNGRPAASVTPTDGATALPISDLDAGVVTRGVLLDVAAVRGVDWLEPGDGVFPDDLLAAEERQGVRVEAGDAVLLRTGYGRKKRERGPDDVRAGGRAGWHVACAPWLRERDVAVIGCDTAQDVHPSGYPALRSPVHAVGIVAMGLWLLDNCDLEPLAATCGRLGRHAFQLVLSPLRLVGVTGSPVNPLALF